jgi:hypothetical protein
MARDKPPLARFSLGTALLGISLICLLLAMLRVLTLKLIISFSLTFLWLLAMGIYGVVGGIALLQVARLVLDKIQELVDRADEENLGLYQEGRAAADKPTRDF